MSKPSYAINVVFEAGNRFQGGLKEQTVKCATPKAAVDFLRIVNAAALQTDQRLPPKGTRMRRYVSDFLDKYAGEIGTYRLARPGKIVIVNL